jgi:predicted membrane-bound dolichyl-phosphate-mannose-protein mannosyltransferase
VKASSYRAIEAFARATNATDVVFGWPIGDASGIDKYLNLEHPPLMKYILCLFMLLLGDRPIFWRIPSILMGAALVVLTFFIARRLGAKYFLALIAAGLVAIDPLVYTMASVAMLDIYVATFTAIAVLLAVKKRFHWAVLATAIASAFKFNGLFAAIPLCAYAFSDTLRRTGSAREAVLTVVYYVCLVFVAFIAIQVLVSIPLIMHLGFANWLSQSITGAIRWHLSTKCVGPNCPPASTPWDWFFGINPFVIYVYDNHSIAAEGFVGLYAVAFILAILSITSFATTRPLSREAWYAFIGTWLGYVIIWFLGAKTQYSFYAVQIVPYLYIFAVMRLWELLDRSEVVAMFMGWKKVFSALWSAFLSIFR